MSLNLYYRTRIHDPEGKLVKDSGLKPSHSFVIQFLEFIEAMFDGITKTGTDTLNAEERIHNVAYKVSQNFNAVGLAGVILRGIVVGTNAGTTAEDNTNYKLDTIIEHATETASKLNYQQTVFVAPQVTNGNVDFDISRPFINDSGGTISVKEIGVYFHSFDTAVYKSYLLCRDVITQEDVLDGYTLTVTYTLRTAV